MTRPHSTFKLEAASNSNMSSSAASSSKAPEKPPKTDEQMKVDDPQSKLGVLEEDDEFEEFAVAGVPGDLSLSMPCSRLVCRLF